MLQLLIKAFYLDGNSHLSLMHVWHALKVLCSLGKSSPVHVVCLMFNVSLSVFQGAQDTALELSVFVPAAHCVRSLRPAVWLSQEHLLGQHDKRFWTTWTLLGPF